MIRDGIYYAVALVVAGLGLTYAALWLAALPLFLLAAFCLYFFRDPNRTVPDGAVAVSPADGKAMFMEYCAVCHGQEGKGNGPAASALKKAPADLTQLTAHSSDGKFPGVHVSRYIGGDDAVQAHGTRDMPIWGDVFKSMNNQLTATQGVSNLADYVKPIQAK